MKGNEMGKKPKQGKKDEKDKKAKSKKVSAKLSEKKSSKKHGKKHGKKNAVKGAKAEKASKLEKSGKAKKPVKASLGKAENAATKVHTHISKHARNNNPPKIVPDVKKTFGGGSSRSRKGHGVAARS